MKLDQLKIDAVEDGQPIKDIVIKEYSLQNDDIFSIKGTNYSNFVGIVQRGTHILISMPKHFKNMQKFNSSSIKEKRKDIKLIMDSVITSTLNYQNATNDDYQKFYSDFALTAYFKIYTYFSKYGLYNEELDEISPKNGKKISWKDTIHKSNKFLINGDLVFSSIFYKQKRNHETLVTECMIFVLNYTQSILGEIMTLPNTSDIANRGVNLSILRNEAIVRKLEKILDSTFKDIHRQLIRNIILFLKKVNSMNEQVLDIKEHRYDRIWEKAVEKYLNTCYKSKVVITNTASLDDIKFKKVIFSNFNLADGYKKWRLEPDHFYKDDDSKVIYMLDSKYYTNNKELNHKQFVYHILLSNKYPDYRVFDSLILPTAGKNKKYLYLNVEKSYLRKDNKHIKIYITELNMIDVLKNYTC